MIMVEVSKSNVLLLLLLDWGSVLECSNPTMATCEMRLLMLLTAFIDLHNMHEHDLIESSRDNPPIKVGLMCLPLRSDNLFSSWCQT